jgi:SAM-dependent methyltransferase
VDASTWADGEAYEQFIGRWSRAAAPRFLDWMQVPAGAHVLDAGCGPGALTEALLAGGAASVVGVDLSAEFIAQARRRVADPRARFAQGDVQALPERDGIFDAAVSALMLHFAPDPARAVSELVRVTKAGGCVGAYVWDYAGKMEMLRAFWDAAVAADPEGAGPLDEGTRFPICQPRPLAALFAGAGLTRVSTIHIDVPTLFLNFAAYWLPFMGGQGPAGGYVATLGAEGLKALRKALEARVSPSGDGPITMVARAWAVKGTVPDEGKPAARAPPSKRKAPARRRAPSGAGKAARKPASR